MKPTAYGIVRWDRSGPQTAEHVAEIRALAQRNDFDLRGIFVRDSDANFGLLLATTPRRVDMTECRLMVYLDDGPALHYRAEECVAYAFAAAAHRQGLARVTIDQLVTPELSPLPCARLWLP